MGDPGELPIRYDGGLELHVVSGPDAGFTYPLTPGGPLLIGRQSSCDVPLADPDLSRRHAELETADGIVRIRDLLSANGTWLSGSAVGETGRPLPVNTAVRVGGSTLLVRTPDQPAAAAVPDGEGHLLVNRRRPLGAPRPESIVELPPPPQEPARQHLPWLMVLAPLLLAVPAAIIWRQPAYLLIAVLSPLLMLAQYLTDRRRGRREGLARTVGHQTAVREAQQQLQRSLTADAEYLDLTHPDLARIGTMARIPTTELWHRTAEHPAALTVRLGRGEVPSSAVIRDASSPAGHRRPTHPDAPVVLELKAFRVIGISGRRESALSTARSIIGQLSVLHSPLDLSISLLRSKPPGADLAATPEGADEWDWLNWLPHHRPPETSGSRKNQPSVLVLDGARRLRGQADVARVLAQAGTADPHADRPVCVVVCLERDESALPLECSATIVHATDQARATLRRAGQPPLSFRPDLAGSRWAARLARDLAPLRDATPEGAGGLPEQVHLLEELRQGGRPEPVETTELAQAWARSDPIRAVLGRSATGQVVVDLAADGPHLLIGGTTGAGKSELLQTLIASLALGSSPQRLTFLLVDYKGGAAFQSCTRLPHVGAVLTDLDPQSAQRALISFSAELRRRERILLNAGCVDIESYLTARQGDGSLDPMPRLMVIVDEFRVLAEEIPEFVTGLVRIATVGRSLGIHLVLATQRPAGVVSPDITANMNLRIALRVRDAADSQDLISDPAASVLPSIPGRALLRAGADPPVQFQTARVLGRTPALTTGKKATVRVLDTAQAPAPTMENEEEAGPVDLERVVVAAQSAAALLGLDHTQAPWLPELPTDLSTADLAAPVTGRSLPFGLIDLPEEQLQEPAFWDLSTGHLAVVGGPRSGRSNVIRSLCTTAARIVGLAGVRDVHCSVLDATGQLGDLERDGWAAVIRPDDHERAERLLRLMLGVLQERQAEPVARDPVLLLVDGWEALTSAWAEPGLMDLHDDLLRLLRDGPGCGICVAVTGGVQFLTGHLSSLFPQRLVLALPDPADAMVLGVPAGAARGTGPPGRGWWLAPPRNAFHQLQVARPATGVSGRRVRTDDAWRVPALPVKISRAHLPRVGAHGRRSPGLVPIGIGGDRTQPIRLDVLAAPVTVVLGSRGSGRSTALASLWEGLRECGLPAFLFPAGTARQAQDVSTLAGYLREEPGSVVLLDHPPGPELPGPGTDQLPEVLALHLAAGGHLVVAASGPEIAAAYRGVLALARDARQGLVLGAVSPIDGDVLGVRLNRRPAGPPGRGLLIVGGKVLSLQVAHPDGPADDGRTR
ncbi:FtsK/SpoIIIE domain-containing protein [Kineosporia babensis]